MTPAALRWVELLKQERRPLPLVMRELIDSIAQDWPPASSREVPDWEGLRGLDYDAEYDRLSEWLDRIFAREPPGPEINGLYFGLIHPPADFTSTVGFFVTGSRAYGQDRDWARRIDDYTPDEPVTDSPLMTEAYRIFLRAGDPLFWREHGIAFYHQFASLVVAEWFCSPMRHRLRGNAASRSLYVGIDPWMGIVVGTLEPERWGGSGSLVITWKGACGGGPGQAGLITATRQVANWHHERWNQVSPRVMGGLASLAALMGRSAPERPLVRWFDEELTGRLLVLDDVFADRNEFVREVHRHGLELEPLDPQNPGTNVLRLDQLEVRGVDFRLFDPRGLYPGEDRMSFVLLKSTRAPFLNGLLVQIDDRAFCRASPFPVVATADWLAQCPFVHLRDYFQEWTGLFLIWLRHFHAPDLVIRPEEEVANAAWLVPVLQDLEDRHGTDRAAEISFQRVRLAFRVEADRWESMFGAE